jgi:hypothetical protein
MIKSSYRQLLKELFRSYSRLTCPAIARTGDGGRPDIFVNRLVRLPAFGGDPHAGRRFRYLGVVWGLGVKNSRLPDYKVLIA